MKHYINEMILQARKASKKENTPVGAIIVKNNEVIAKAYNTKNATNIAVNHAEILVIIKACKKLNRWILDDCDLYVTLKPCDMCIGAIKEARIRKIYYLLESNYEHVSRETYKMEKISDNLLEDEYKKILSNFFKTIR